MVWGIISSAVCYKIIPQRSRNMISSQAAPLPVQTIAADGRTRRFAKVVLDPTQCMRTPSARVSFGRWAASGSRPPG